MDLSKYDSDIEIINLSGNQLQRINWEGCPQGLQIICLNDNKIQKIEWEGCPQGLQEIYLDNNYITTLNWQSCPQRLQEMYIHYNQIQEIDWTGCPLYLEVCEPFTGQLREYKKTPEFLMRFYGKENLEKNFITKPRRNLNIELVATSFLGDNHHVKVFNHPMYKENYYDHVREMQELLN